MALSAYKDEAIQPHFERLRQRGISFIWFPVNKVVIVESGSFDRYSIWNYVLGDGITIPSDRIVAPVLEANIAPDQHDYNYEIEWEDFCAITDEFDAKLEIAWMTGFYNGERNFYEWRENGN